MPITLTTQQLNYNGGDQYVTIDAISPPIEAGHYMPIDAGITNANVGDIVRVAAVDAEGHPIAYEPSPIFHTLTINITNTNGDYITNVPVKIRHNTYDGEIYAADTTTNQPLSFSLPTGFPYYVDLTWPDSYYNFTEVNSYGIVQQTNITCNITFLGVGDLHTASDVKMALNNHIDLTSAIGSSITCTNGDDTITWDIVDYHHKVDSAFDKSYVIIMAHNAIAELDITNQEALYYGQLSPGNYKFHYGLTDYYFTITTATSNVGHLIATNREFHTYYSYNSTTVLESGTVSTTELPNATDLGTTGQGSLNNMNRVIIGSNNYAESDILVWLNSTQAADTAINKYSRNNFSRPYIYDVDGFLKNLDPAFTSCIDIHDWQCNTNNDYECSSTNGGSFTKDSTYTVSTKFGLASLKEIFGTYDHTDDGSTQFALFVDADADDLKRYTSDGRVVNWALRTPVSTNSYRLQYIDINGELDTTNRGYTTYGIVPVAYIAGTSIA